MSERNSNITALQGGIIQSVRTAMGDKLWTPRERAITDSAVALGLVMLLKLEEECGVEMGDEVIQAMQSRLDARLRGTGPELPMQNPNDEGEQ